MPSHPSSSALPGGPTVEERAPGSPDRFEFGRNWANFLRHLTHARIAEAERSLQAMLGAERLSGASFVDVGSGSGLFSLAAMRSGAARVHSFDFDPASVACAEALRQRYFPGSRSWTIERGSALDASYIASLGTFDMVYSWGVLHHTGRMWDALANVAGLVRPGGTLFISIYNDQGATSTRWKAVKRLYNRCTPGRIAVLAAFIPYFAGRGFAADIVRGRNPLRRYRDYQQQRGMSMVHDWIDWLGGYPFEVAKPEQIFDFYTSRGFVLRKLTTCGGSLGCNEFVFDRSA